MRWQHYFRVQDTALARVVFGFLVVLRKQLLATLVGGTCNGRLAFAALGDCYLKMGAGDMPWYLATRKRVDELLHTHSVRNFILGQLFSDVLAYFLLITPYSIYKVPPCPKVSISIFVFQICMPVKNQQTAFSFEISHDLCIL